MIELKIKRLTDTAVLPKYAKHGDAGMDLTVDRLEEGTDKIRYYSGIAVEIPEGCVGLLFPRSSVYKVGIHLSNSVGVIDSGYRGEVQAVFYQKSSDFPTWEDIPRVGDRFAQLVIMELPKVEILEVSELSESERGIGGFGSTGK